MNRSETILRLADDMRNVRRMMDRLHSAGYPEASNALNDALSEVSSALTHIAEGEGEDSGTVEDAQAEAQACQGIARSDIKPGMRVTAMLNGWGCVCEVLAVDETGVWVDAVDGEWDISETRIGIPWSNSDSILVCVASEGVQS